MALPKIISNDPLVKMITGKSGTTKRRKTTKRKGTLTASEKRIVSAVRRSIPKARRTTKRRRY